MDNDFSKLLEDLRVLYHTLRVCNVDVMPILHHLLLPHISFKHCFCRLSLPFEIHMKDSYFRIGFCSQEKPETILAFEVMPVNTPPMDRRTAGTTDQPTAGARDVDMDDAPNLGVHFNTLPITQSNNVVKKLKKPTTEEFLELFNQGTDSTMVQRNTDGMLLTKAGRKTDAATCEVKQAYFGDQPWKHCPPEIVAHMRCGTFFDFLEFKCFYFRIVHAIGQPLKFAGLESIPAPRPDCMIQTDAGPVVNVPGAPITEEHVFAKPKVPPMRKKNKKDTLDTKTGLDAEGAKRHSEDAKKQNVDKPETEGLQDPNGDPFLNALSWGKPLLAEAAAVAKPATITSNSLKGVQTLTGSENESTSAKPKDKPEDKPNDRGGREAGKPEEASKKGVQTLTASKNESTSAKPEDKPEDKPNDGGGREARKPDDGTNENAQTDAHEKSASLPILSMLEDLGISPLSNRSASAGNLHAEPDVPVMDDGKRAENSSGTDTSEADTVLLSSVWSNPGSPTSLNDVQVSSETNPSSPSIHLELNSNSSNDPAPSSPSSDQMCARLDNLLSMIRDIQGAKKKKKQKRKYCCDKQREEEEDKDKKDPSNDDSEPPPKMNKA